MISTHKESRSEENREFPEQTYLHFASEALLIDNNSLKRETARDAILGRVLGYIRDGWPQDIEIKDIKPYFHRQKELYEELGCVMWGHRVVVPSSCREKVLAELHEAHMGITKTKQFARSYVWWPGIDKAVVAVCRACSVCARAWQTRRSDTSRARGCGQSVRGRDCISIFRADRGRYLLSHRGRSF
ncbi:unnamed protein product [Parnassius mnemosyne]|uniref:RNA-directed DNA polymerase n=1 Tax=Parnassius mnemosyne TaxID=213953 RepID=A0AAV1KQJ1_9NEOP